MRTKIYFLAFIFLCLGGMAIAGNKGDIPVADGPGEGGPTTNPPAARRMLAVSPISLRMEENKTLQVSFNTDLGVVTVSVKDEAGTVYYVKAVNTSTTGELTVDVAVLPVGTYTITFVNTATSLKKYGIFEID